MGWIIISCGLDAEYGKKDETKRLIDHDTS